MSQSLSQTVADFMASEEVASCSLSSRKRTRIVLNRLVSVVGEDRPDKRGGNEPVSRLGRRHIDRTLNTWRGKVVDATLNAYRSDLRKFGRYCVECVETTGVKIDPSAHLKNAKTETPAAKRKPISAEQARRLMQIAEEIHPRDGMTAKIMLLTGLRESEVVGLTWGDVKTVLDDHFAKAYRPKRKNWHTVYWTPQLIEAMTNWREYYETKHGKTQPGWFVVPALAHRADKPGFWKMDRDWPMVPTHRQNSLGPKRVKLWLAAVGETDLKGRASHTLRRTAANLLMDFGGADIRETQTFLGHDSQAMTELYIDRNAAGDRLRTRAQSFQI